MQPAVTFVFTAQEILEQVHRELIKLGANMTSISVEEWKRYVLARAIEDLLLVDLTPSFDARMEMMANLVRSNYRRQDGEETLTIHEDVGTNKLHLYLESCDLPFESQLELHRNRVTLGPRQSSR